MKHAHIYTQCDEMQGYIVGNGIVDDKYDGYVGRVPFAYGMGLISTDMYEVGL